MVSIAELTLMQNYPLDLKVKKSLLRIREWYESHQGNIHVSFSGGIDSTALLHLARSIYPDIPAVFCNTGMEYPEIVEFVSTIPNVTIIRPEHGYKWAVEHYGYPVISKATSVAISRYRTAKDDVQRNLRLYGGINPTSGKMQRTGVIPKKYHYLIDAPFPISDKCCEVLKKRPLHKYSKDHYNSAPMTGEMATDSNLRKMKYLSHGCNFFGKEHKSTPFGFWTQQQDILPYILLNKIPYCEKIYGKIEYDPEKKIFFTTGEHHTGCYGCMFGVHLEDPENNRFIRMKQTHPAQHNVCINVFGQKKVLDFIGVKYE